MPTNDKAILRPMIGSAFRVKTRVLVPGMKTVNATEITVIQNLIAWVAVEQDTAPGTVERVTEVRFGIDDIGDLPRTRYDEAVRFLVGFRIDEI
jgi:hypothetical protein